MEWIKKNPHQLALAVCSLGLIGASVSILLNAQSFPERFSSVQTAPPTNPKGVPPLELGPLQQAQEHISKPGQWSPDVAGGALFVPERYTVENNQPKKLTEGSPNKDRVTGQPIPNAWFIENKFNPLDQTVVKQDPDNDGFQNDDEYRAKTNPNDPKSHPPYYSKLFLKQYIKVPFRLRFEAHDPADVKRKIPATFQINTLDLRQPSEFLQIGQNVPRTPYKIEGFAEKEAENPATGEKTDVSELTLVNTETGDKVVLVKNKVTDSPESFAMFSYLWPTPPQDIRVKKLGEFVLRPNVQEKYKVLDIQETQVVIQLPSGEKYTVPRLPPNYP
jgi:hypothetical protein